MTYFTCEHSFSIKFSLLLKSMCNKLVILLQCTKCFNNFYIIPITILL